MTIKKAARREAALPHKVSFSESWGSVVSEKDFQQNNIKLQNSADQYLQEYAREKSADNFVLWLNDAEIISEFSSLPDENLCTIKPTQADDYSANLLPEFLQNIYKNAKNWQINVNATLEKPLLLVLTGQNNAFEINVAKNSALTLIEETSNKACDYFIFRNLKLADSAAVEHNILRTEKENAEKIQKYFSFSFCKTENYASYKRTGLNLLNAIFRDEFHVEMAKNSQVNISEACLSKGKNRASYYWPVLHASGETASKQRFHAALADFARVEFFGRIQVPPYAQKSDAEQQSRFLMLSENAQARSRPELEILADDVKCKHGAAIGALDKMALFYLQARGLSDSQARMLLVEAFVAEIADEFSTKWLISIARDAISAWLSDDLEKRLT